jgi:hypothetical protein
LVGHDDSRLFECRSYMLGSRRRLRLCLSEINRLIPVYSIAAQPEPQPTEAAD